LVERIQADPALRNTLIVMLTSGDRPEDLTRCQELKVAAYLLKPVKQSELFDAILNALGIGEGLQREPSAPATAAPRRRPLNILLAEDSLVNQKLATSLLQRQGHQVRVVNNGREALAALASSQFELILMDIQMPEMDGLEATRQIRALEQGCGRRTPILAMTAHALKGDRQRCLETGMDGYIAKPVRAQDLLRAIDEVLPC
jgi:two-component system, sensor histidine kinase and response regulator